MKKPGGTSWSLCLLRTSGGGSDTGHWRVTVQITSLQRTRNMSACGGVCVCVSVSPLLDVLFILLQYWFYLFFQFRNSEKHTNTQMDNNTKIARAGEASELRTRCADTDSWCVSCFSTLLLMWQSSPYLTAVVFECFRLHLRYSVRSPQLIYSVIGGKNVEQHFKSIYRKPAIMVRTVELPCFLAIWTPDHS